MLWDARFARYCLCCALLALLPGPRSLCAAEVTQSNAESPVRVQAKDIRKGLRFTADEIVLLGVSVETYRLILAETEEYARSAPPPAAGGLPKVEIVSSVKSARSDEQVSLDKQRAIARLSTLRTIDQHKKLFATLTAMLTPQQQVLHARLVENSGLPANLALLTDLSAEQGRLLCLAQERRIRVLANPLNWHRHSVRSQAATLFDATLARILTPQQTLEYGTFREAERAHLIEALQAERSARAALRAQRQVFEPAGHGGLAGLMMPEQVIQATAEHISLFDAALSVWTPTDGQRTQSTDDAAVSTEAKPLSDAARIESRQQGG